MPSDLPSSTFEGFSSLSKPSDEWYEPISSPALSGVPLDSMSDDAENSLVTGPRDDSPHNTIMFHAKNANVGSGCQLHTDTGAIGHCLRLLATLGCVVRFNSELANSTTNAVESAHILLDVSGT